MKTKNEQEPESGIILLAKKHGKTSFASLSSVKHALGTGKVGHTGTLDSFADGLLVVLSGRLTRLVPHITNFDKKYIALIEFGSETDTLDPTGNIIKTSEKIPTKDEVEFALQKFVGEIDQIPPLFSALHIDGKRASDLAREGKNAVIPARKITIFDIKLLDFKEKYALVEVHCSKGTYIRSLARDIAYECGTFAHLEALRRTKVGPFSLEDATFYSELDEFSINSLLKNPRNQESPKEENKDFEKENARIKSNLKTMTPEFAEYCGMNSVFISSLFVDSYSNGRPLNRYVFSNFFKTKKELPKNAELAVFYPKGKFGGVITKQDNKFSYGFVIPPKKNLEIFTWEQIINGEFNEKFKNQGTALTIGSFDGTHIGHNAIFDSVLEQKSKRNLATGVVTFSHSLQYLKNSDSYSGDISSLNQKIKDFVLKGFDFVIIIDFSVEFGKIKGDSFLKTLVDLCGMKHLSEGKDFCCGYKNTADVKFIEEFSEENNFSLQVVDSIRYKNEKVSSSRIRSCIQNKDLESVEKMLERPFILDCTDFDWDFVSESELVAKIIKTKQIIPVDGNYKVLVIVSADENCKKSGEKQSNANVRAYRSNCTLENGILRLSFSDKLISRFVLAVQFDCAD